MIGACTAYFLSQNPQTAVTVVEKSSPACAASGKAGGFLALDWCDGGPVSSLARASFKLHKSLAEKFNGEEVYGYRALTTLSVPVLSEPVASSSLRGSNLLPDWVDGETARPAKQIGTTETTAQVLKRNELGIPSETVLVFSIKPVQTVHSVAYDGYFVLLFFFFDETRACSDK